MRNIEVYRRNLDTLAANADVVNQLTATMDDALEQSNFEFEGKPYGEWAQIAGDPNVSLTESSRTHARGILSEINSLETCHAMVQEKSPMGINWYKSLNLALRGVVHVDARPTLLRRLTAQGMETGTGEKTAQHYRFEWQEPEVAEQQNIFVLARLGRFAVDAQIWHVVDQTEFAEKCCGAFANRQVINDVLSGTFTSERQLDRMIASLGALDDQAVLIAELRTKALAARENNELAGQFDVVMPSRDEMAQTLQILQQTF
jgi:hypothetical protein